MASDGTLCSPRYLINSSWVAFDKSRVTVDGVNRGVGGLCSGLRSALIPDPGVYPGGHATVYDTDLDGVYPCVSLRSSLPCLDDSIVDQFEVDYFSVKPEITARFLAEPVPHVYYLTLVKS